MKPKVIKLAFFTSGFWFCELLIRMGMIVGHLFIGRSKLQIAAIELAAALLARTTLVTNVTIKAVLSCSFSLSSKSNHTYRFFFP